MRKTMITTILVALSMTGVLMPPAAAVGTGDAAAGANANGAGAGTANVVCVPNPLPIPPYSSPWWACSAAAAVGASACFSVLFGKYCVSAGGAASSSLTMAVTGPDAVCDGAGAIAGTVVDAYSYGPTAFPPSCMGPIPIGLGAVVTGMGATIGYGSGDCVQANAQAHASNALTSTSAGATGAAGECPDDIVAGVVGAVTPLAPPWQGCVRLGFYQYGALDDGVKIGLKDAIKAELLRQLALAYPSVDLDPTVPDFKLAFNDAFSSKIDTDGIPVYQPVAFYAC